MGWVKKGVRAYHDASLTDDCTLDRCSATPEMIGHSRHFTLEKRPSPDGAQAAGRSSPRQLFVSPGLLFPALLRAVAHSQDLNDVTGGNHDPALILRADNQLAC